MAKSWKVTINRQVRTREHKGAVRGLQLATEHLLQVSRERVPIEEGTLERSGVASVDPGRLIGAVSYDTPYAVVQHEDLSLQHDAGREAKYLEKTMLEERPVVEQILAREVRRGLD